MALFDVFIKYNFNKNCPSSNFFYKYLLTIKLFSTSRIKEVAMKQDNTITTLTILASKRPNLILRPEETIGSSDFMDPNSHSGAAAVVNDGKLIGILTERDLLKRVLARDLRPSQTPVMNVMTYNPISVQSNATLHEALHVITENGYRYLPVLDGDKFVGMIDVRDLYGEVQWLLQDNMDRQSRVFNSMMREPYGYGGDKKTSRAL
jgi:CBS domain-containing protein